eukprot:CAMPEP_0172359352 /NCGR_PEP_ID=MMETSP1060-20121228/3562_1 /TAXON_ID=37318 /ORGANISM="Pseudo-nitzschia pungens, Strain cf. cingulata" /LENGTH=287 /DNA_ID=CAMNT_0013080963 /DNA_START=115 /DNA_END=978 /DNA_ORIENTATION=-
MTEPTIENTEDGSTSIEESDTKEIANTEDGSKSSKEIGSTEIVTEDDNAVDDEASIEENTTTTIVVKDDNAIESSKENDKKKKNPLTHLIPGYTARMKLDSSSLDKYRCGIGELRRRAERQDASTKSFVLEATTDKANSSMKKTKEGFLPKSYGSAYSRFKHGAKRAPDDTAGKGWFGMKPSAMTDDIKTDLAIIRNRTYLDPKRFYKSTDKHHKIVQVGTVIEGASEFYSSRLTKKERRSNLTEELMADQATTDYAKNKFQKMAREKAYQAELRKNRPKKRSRKFY